MSNTNNPQAEKVNKKVGYRLLAALFAIVCVGFIFLPINVVKGTFTLEQTTLLKLVPELLKSETKLFGFIPVLTGTSLLGTAASLVLYALILALVISFILAVIAIFVKKPDGLVITVVFFVTWVAAAYALSVLILTSYLNTVVITFDWYSIGLAVVGAFFYWILMLVKTGGSAWMNTLHFLLSLAISAAIILAVTYDGHTTAQVINNNHVAYTWIIFGVLGASILNLFIASCRAMDTKGYSGDLFRYILQVILALGTCYLMYHLEMQNDFSVILCLGAAIVAVIQILMVSGQIKYQHTKKVKETKADAVKDFTVEETIEAYAYEGGPVAGVEMAELATNENAENGEELTEAGQYSGKNFDAFIATLSDDERDEFIDLYVLKTNGAMPEIPTYEVGAENKQFFKKVFIYLGLYREKISNALLAKIYAHSKKLDN